jgi:hypothetical protein
MLNFTLPDAGAVDAVADRLSDAGLEVLPAAVAVMVLTALAAALVITALRRREGEQERGRSDDHRPIDEDALLYAGAERVDA